MVSVSETPIIVDTKGGNAFSCTYPFQMRKIPIAASINLSAWSPGIVLESRKTIPVVVVKQHSLRAIIR